MEAHPILGCIQDQSSWGWVLQITIRSCMNFSWCLNGSVPSLLQWEQNRAIGLGPCMHLTVCHSWLFPTALGSGTRLQPTFRRAVKHRDKGCERLF